MSIYSDKLAHVQIVNNCGYSIAQMYTREDTLAHNLGVLFIDDLMRHNTLKIKLLNLYFGFCVISFNVYFSFFLGYQ